ncbi:MAG: tyrosine-type recombinase/integrase [Polyangiales bacterium]
MTKTTCTAGGRAGRARHAVGERRGFATPTAVDRTAARPRNGRAARLTKTKSARAFDIEDAVLPLVERLVAARPTGALLRLPVDEHRASLLREHLRRAGVERQELYVERDPTRMPFTFHGLRHTHLTWMAVRGDDSVKIQMRAGHTDFKMTQRYIEAARTLGGGFGTPFPALPARLVTGPLGAREASALTPDELAAVTASAAVMRRRRSLCPLERRRIPRPTSRSRLSNRARTTASARA